MWGVYTGFQIWDFLYKKYVLYVTETHPRPYIKILIKLWKEWCQIKLLNWSTQSTYLEFKTRGLKFPNIAEKRSIKFPNLLSSIWRVEEFLWAWSIWANPGSPEVNPSQHHASYYKHSQHHKIATRVWMWELPSWSEMKEGIKSI